MKFRLALVGALASAVVGFALSATVPSPAAADMRIAGDPGGEVASYVRKFEAVRASGERVIIDGPCLSACTLLLGIVPRDHICVTHQAVLGFHAASYYDDASRSLVPTREGSRLVMQVYPPAIRSWIVRHGGLRPALIELRGRELAEMYPACH
ncbi:MAG TPA: hypothetical protein VL976_04300 [Xanthobacteraceae bacterium]|jgi:hypothetical protein|nr:hypothetical protein [Xanthobacteraceae bacterium]